MSISAAPRRPVVIARTVSDVGVRAGGVIIKRRRMGIREAAGEELSPSPLTPPPPACSSGVDRVVDDDDDDDEAAAPSLLWLAGPGTSFDLDRTLRGSPRRALPVLPALPGLGLADVGVFVIARRAMARESSLPTV